MLLQALLCLVDKKTGEKSKSKPRFVKQDQVAIMRLECAGVVCMEPFKEFPQMGRFTLRDEGMFCVDISHVTLSVSRCCSSVQVSLFLQVKLLLLERY